MSTIKCFAVSLLLSCSTAVRAEQISGRAEFIALSDVPRAGLLAGDPGLITFGFESENGSIVAGIEYRVKADFLEYDFGSVNSRFEGDIDLIISEDRGFGTDGLIIDANLPSVSDFTGISVNGESENFINTLDPTELVFNWSSRPFIRIQSDVDPTLGFTAGLTWLSVPEPTCSCYCIIALVGVAQSRTRRNYVAHQGSA